MIVNAAMMLAMLFSLKTVELLENGLQPLFWSDFIVFSENRIARVMAAFTLTLSVNGP